MLQKKSFLTVSTLAILMVIQSSGLGVLPTGASASNRFELSQGKAPNPSPTDRGTTITIGTDFPVEITDVKYLSFQVSPLNSELGLRRDDGFHRIKIFWKEFSGCLSPVENAQVQAKLVFRDGKERVFAGKLNATQDCNGGSCFSTVAVPGFLSDGSPNRFEVQIRDAARFVGSTSNGITIGQFPPVNTVTGTVTYGPGNTVNIGPSLAATTGLAVPQTSPSVQVTNIEYVGLFGNTHQLKLLYKVSKLTCFNKRPEFIGSSASISLSVTDKQTGKNRLINSFGQQLNLSQDCSSAGDCSSAVSVPGNATDAQPTAKSASIGFTVSVNAVGFGERKASF